MRAAVLHVVADRRSGGGDAQNSQAHPGAEATLARPRGELQSAAGVSVRREGAQGVEQTEDDTVEEEVALRAAKIRFSSRGAGVSQIHQGEIPAMPGSVHVSASVQNAIDDRAGGLGTAAARSEGPAAVPDETVHRIQRAH